MNRFFMVWNEGNLGPTIQHSSEKEARTEIERLARKHPGRKFYLLVATDYCRVNDISWASMEDL